jgi:rhamnosyltransferase
MRAPIPRPLRANTWAVVVLYRPEGDLWGRLRAAAEQVAGLVVVANDGVMPPMPAEASDCRLEFVVNTRNFGLGAALNQGIRRAQAAGASWVLLLDQDTLVRADLVCGLGEVWAAYPAPQSVAILAPNYRSHDGAQVAYDERCPWQHVSTAVTSGSLVATAAVDACGSMRADFFIEAIDLEFALRVRAAGWRLVASGTVLMTHAAGAGREYRIFGRRALVGDHPPWRCYLQIRNLVWTLRHHWRTDPAWAGLTILAIGKKFLLVCLAETEATEKLAAWVRGTADAWAERLPPPFEQGGQVL